MTFNDILLAADKQIVASAEGTITKLSKPKDESELTDGQKKVGIHPQFLTITDDNGISIDCQIIKKEKHLSPDHRGQRVRFEAGNNDGRPIGLKVSAYQGKVRLEIGSGASITRLDNEPAKPEPAKQEQKVAMPQAKAATAWKQSELTDHVNCLSMLFQQFKAKLGAVVELDDISARLATSVYIQACKEGIPIKGYSPIVVEEEKPKAETTIDKFADLVLNMEVTSKNENGKKLKEIIDMGLFTYEQLSEAVKAKFEDKKGFDDQMATIKAWFMSRKEDAEKCYEVAMTDFEAFKGKIESDRIPY